MSVDIAPYLKRMKSPQDPRKGIWRNGVLQIWVTRACDKACIGCTQGSNLVGPFARITPEQFRVACRSLRNPDYPGVIGMFGGNAVVHPQFDELCAIMCEEIPFEQRGLWSNKLFGHGKVCRETFNPRYSNLNVHLDQEAYAEIRRDWPEADPKGHDCDSRHSPPYVAMQDVIGDEAERWELISKCDVNQYWSALIGVFRGELRGYFCELAYAQAALHQHEPDYPDLGHLVVPGWWDKPIEAFEAQIRYHCHACGIPLRGYGDFATNGTVEQVSKTHANIYKPKVRDREVQLVTLRSELGPKLGKATDYIENGRARPVVAVKRIDGLVTCVGEGYAKFLDEALPTWLATLDSITVVTAPGDPAIAMCSRHSSSKLAVHVTDIFFQHGAHFNKGAALNEGLNLMRPVDWVLNFDADVVPPLDWRPAQLESGCLYGTSRYYAPDSDRDWDTRMLRENPHRGHKREIRNFQQLRQQNVDRVPDHDLYGYFHLWHVSDPRTQSRPLWDVCWNNAGQYDTTFLERWLPALRRRLPIRLIHRGTPRANWFGPNAAPNLMRAVWSNGLRNALDRRYGALDETAVADLVTRIGGACG